MRTMHISSYIFIPLIWILGSCRDENTKTNIARKSETFCLDDSLNQNTAILSITEKPIQEQLTLSGVVNYDENNLVAFRTLLEGVVDEVHFDLGDAVHEGQVLAKIRSAQIQELDQQKRMQQNQKELLEKQLASKQSLFRDGFVTEPELLETEHALEQSKIELERIQESLKLYRAIGNGHFQLLAPKDGYIIQKNISVGQSITTNEDPLFSISNLKETWVMVNIYASNLRFVHQGDGVQVRTIAYPDVLYNGRIDKIYNVFDDNEHVLKARVILDNQQLQLIPGLAADIIIQKSTPNNKRYAYAIPNKAIIFNNNEKYIVIYRDPCTMRIRKVTPIASNETYTYIQDKIAPEEKVIGSNALLIFEQLNP